MSAHHVSNHAHKLPPPDIASMQQIRLALLQTGRLDIINKTVAALPGIEGEAVRIEWEYAKEIHRNSPHLAIIAARAGWSGAGLDTLFRLAASL
jgi:hypothetical protein